MKPFVYYYVPVTCNYWGDIEEIRACVSHYNQPPELPVNGEARNDAHIASTDMRLYERTPRVATPKKRNGKVMHQKVR